jgi:RimJ/RimL family protein N-acetyltransferase
MTSDLIYSPLLESDLPELEHLLRKEAVYSHIGGLPSEDDFYRWHRAALRGPPPDRAAEHWLNFAVRGMRSGELIGKLEATIHDNLAEVAYLFGEPYWGRGYATQGLLWLSDFLLARDDVHALWATTDAANRRSSALLIRCGFHGVAPSLAPAIYSYDDGDLVFTKQAEA